MLRKRNNWWFPMTIFVVMMMTMPGHTLEGFNNVDRRERSKGAKPPVSSK
jgi:hypothetical protein